MPLLKLQQLQVLPRNPIIKISDDKLSMTLDPIPTRTKPVYPRIRQGDIALVNIVFQDNVNSLDHTFFDDAFDVVNVSRVFHHLQDFHKNSNPTLKRRYYPLKAFEEFLETQGLVSRIRLHRLKIKKGRQNPQPYLTTNEMLQVLELARATYDRNAYQNENLRLRDLAILEVFFGTGIRVSELAQIGITDIKLTNKSILIREGKGGKSRTVYLPKKSIPAVRRYIKHRENIFNIKPDGKNYLFVTRLGKPMDRVSVYRRIQRYVDAAGISKKITPHSLRKTAATTLFEHGAREREIQVFLDHEHLSTTARYLSETTPKLDKILRKHHPQG